MTRSCWWTISLRNISYNQIINHSWTNGILIEILIDSDWTSKLEAANQTTGGTRVCMCVFWMRVQLESKKIPSGFMLSSPGGAGTPTETKVEPRKKPIVGFCVTPVSAALFWRVNVFEDEGEGFQCMSVCVCQQLALTFRWILNL